MSAARVLRWRRAQEHRAALVRAVVARDWAVAVAMFRGLQDTLGFASFGDQAAMVIEDTARLPTPDEFVAEMLGETR